MQMNYVLQPVLFDEGVTPVEPVLLAEIKTYLRRSADETFDDTLITQLITAARQQLETYLNISLISKTITAILQIENGAISLPYTSSAITITSVKDENGNTITGYSLKGDQFCALPAGTATPANNFYQSCNSQFTVIYTVSWETKGLPVHFKIAIMQQVAYLYEKRGDEMETALSPLVKISLHPYRRIF